MSPQGNDGLTWDSITSPTREKASVCRSAIGPPVERLPAEEDGLAEAQLVDPTEIVGPEGPLEVGRVAARHEVDGVVGDSLDRRHQVGQLGHVAGIGGHAALTGQVGADPVQSERRAARRSCVDDLDEIAGEDALAEVAELDHEDDAVDRPLPEGRRGQ